MPEVDASVYAAAKPKKLFRSDPDLPAAVNGVADVLQDGVEALLKVVDTKVNWVLPNKWVWIPGDYEWQQETEEGKTPQVKISYKLALKDDNSCEYTWNRVEQTKKKTEHTVHMTGYWKQPEKRKIPIPGENNGSSSSSSAVEDGSSGEKPAEGEAGEGGETSRPATAMSSVSEIPPVDIRVIDALAIVPESVGFSRSTTGSTGKTVKIATKTKSRLLQVASQEEWTEIQQEGTPKDADPILAPFELVFEICESGELLRADTQKAKDVFPSGPTSNALAGIAAKAVARLGEPHAVITDGWMPDETMPLPNTIPMPFSPLQWLATYLKTHSPSYEKHVAGQGECRQWLTDTAQSAKKAEIDAELAVIAAALAAKQKEARDWLEAKAKFALEVMRKEDEEDELDDD